MAGSDRQQWHYLLSKLMKSTHRMQIGLRWSRSTAGQTEATDARRVQRVLERLEWWPVSRTRWLCLDGTRGRAASMRSRRHRRWSRFSPTETRSHRVKTRCWHESRLRWSYAAKDNTTSCTRCIVVAILTCTSPVSLISSWCTCRRLAEGSAPPHAPVWLIVKDFDCSFLIGDDILLVGTARQPLFLVIRSRSIYLCTFVADFRCCKAPRNRLTPGVAHLKRCTARCT